MSWAPLDRATVTTGATEIMTRNSANVRDRRRACQSVIVCLLIGNNHLYRIIGYCDLSRNPPPVKLPLAGNMLRWLATDMEAKIGAGATRAGTGDPAPASTIRQHVQHRARADRVANRGVRLPCRPPPLAGESCVAASRRSGPYTRAQAYLRGP